MIDRKTVREKVVKELESLRDICNAKSNMAIGKGKVAWAGYANAADDALALLKEQEPRAPHYTYLQYSVNGIVHEIKHPECPRCFENGLTLWDASINEGQTYCNRCGQEVKWE